MVVYEVWRKRRQRLPLIGPRLIAQRPCFEPNLSLKPSTLHSSGCSRASCCDVTWQPIEGHRKIPAIWQWLISPFTSIWTTTTSTTQHCTGRSVTDLPEVRRGEVWFATIPGDKQRPVLILSRDPMGQILHSVLCAPITSTIRGISTEVPLGKEAGLAHRSVAHFDNTFLLSRQRLVRRSGKAKPATMTAACAALAIAIGCSHAQS